MVDYWFTFQSYRLRCRQKITINSTLHWLCPWWLLAFPKNHLGKVTKDLSFIEKLRGTVFQIYRLSATIKGLLKFELCFCQPIITNHQSTVNTCVNTERVRWCYQANRLSFKVQINHFFGFFSHFRCYLVTLSLSLLWICHNGQNSVLP